MPFYNPNHKSGQALSSQKQRIEYFRRHHQVGEHVRGKILKYQSTGIAWIEVEGHPLLASLQTNPQLEEIRVFQITQLHPDIVLKELHGQSALSIKELINQFWSDRYKLDSMIAAWQDCQHSTKPRLEKNQAKTSFFQKLAEHKSGFELYAHMLQTLKNLNQELKEQTKAVYWPWFPCLALNHEGFIRPFNSNKKKHSFEQMWEACYAFVLPPENKCFIQIYFRADTARYRVYLSNLHHTIDLQEWLKSYFEQAKLKVQCLGIVPMSESFSGPFQILLKEEVATGKTSIHVQI